MAGVVLASMAAVGPAAAQTTLRVATVVPDGTAWMQVMRDAADEIESRTDGRVRIRYFPGGVMGNEQAVLRRMRIGQLHGAAVTGGALAGLHPDNLLYSLPFLFRSQDEVDHVRACMDAEVIAPLEESGLVSLGFAGGGFVRLMSTEPVASLEDLEGRRIWVPENDPVAYAAMRELGLTPVALPLTDVLTALQTGMVNIVPTPPVGAIAFQWHTRVRYITDTPLAYTWAQLVMDRRALDRLDEADRTVLAEVMEAAYDTLDARNRVDNREALAALLEQGLELVEPAAADRREMERIARRVNRRMIEQGVIDRRLYEALLAHLEAYRSEAVTASAP